MKYRLSYVGDEIQLTKYWRQDGLHEGLAILLDGPNVKINPPDNELKPCFDVEELRRRNIARKGDTDNAATFRDRRAMGSTD